MSQPTNGHDPEARRAPRDFATALADARRRLDALADHEARAVALRGEPVTLPEGPVLRALP